MKDSPELLKMFGCPWHGLIEGGQLTLPNGLTMAMRQPGGMPYEQGNTHLIDLPTAPVTERTPEQQTADAAAGMQWLDKALIAGDQIHGKAIGAGKWIYHASGNWLVSTTLQGAGASMTECSITLDRFGVFGGEPQSYSYTVAIPGLSIAASYWGLADASVNVRHFATHPQGSAATFAVMGRLDPGVYTPIAWLEVTLSGPADACVAAVTMIYSAPDTGGLVTHSDSLDLRYLRRYYNLTSTIEVVDTTSESYPDCSGNYLSTETFDFVEVPDAAYRAFPPGTYTARRATTGIIVGVLYRSTGVRVPVTLDVELDESLVAPALSFEQNVPKVYEYEIVTDGTACARSVLQEQIGRLTVSQSVTTDLAGKLTYKVGGVVAAMQSVTYQTVRTGRLAYEFNQFPGGTATNTSVYSWQWDTTRSSGDFATAGSSGAATGNNDIGSSWPGLSIRSSQILRHPYVNSQSLSGAPDNLPALLLRAQRSSNGVYGFTTRLTGDNNAYPHQYTAPSPVACIDGPADVPVLSYTQESSSAPPFFVYATYSPLTGAVSRSLAGPVCFT